MTWSKSRCSTRNCLSRSTVLKVSVSTLSFTTILNRCQPVSLLVAKGQEIRIQQVVFGVVLAAAGRLGRSTPARTFEDSLRGRRVPFGCRPQPGINVRRAFGDQTYFQRAAHVGDFVRREAREIGGELRRRVAAAADDAQRRRSRRAHGDRPACAACVGSPCAETERRSTCGRAPARRRRPARLCVLRRRARCSP